MIQENNTMIGVFMGDIEYSEKHRGWYCAETMELDSFPLFFKGKGNYNGSWDCLMTVVMECFERLDARDTSADEIKSKLETCHREYVYQAVVKYINQFEL